MRYDSSGRTKSDRALADQLLEWSITSRSSRSHSRTRGHLRIAARRRSNSARSAGGKPARLPKNRNSLGGTATALLEPMIRAISVVPLRLIPPTNTGGAGDVIAGKLLAACEGLVPQPGRESPSLARDAGVPVTWVDEHDRALP